MKVIAGLVVVALLWAALPLLLFIAATPEDGCTTSREHGGWAAGTGTQEQPPAATGPDGLTQTQRQHAAAIIGVGRARQLPDQAIVVALATALQESRLRVYANDGHGGDLAADQHGIAASLRLPHEAVGSDHGSLGLFQQQWPWWGAMHSLMDPTQSAEKFYSALVRVPGWQVLPLTVAAQSVQHSATPFAYADDEPLARRLLSETPHGVGTEASPVTDPAVTTTSDTVVAGVHQGCVTAGLAWSGAEVVRFPLPPGSGYVDRRNFGSRGGHWAHRHTGTDLSVACGTPVLAAAAGTVRIDRTQAWAGQQLVTVSTRRGRLTTWYAHMQQVDVTDGDRVGAGQRLGQVGDRGNATGCHLHFEVHPHGGGYGQDEIDPSTWLQAHVGRQHLRGSQLAVPAMGTTASTARAGAIRVATFNILGSSHTAPGGHHAWWASGPQRAPRAISVLNRWRIDVAALQEVQRNQRGALLDAAGGAFDMYPRPGAGRDNRVIWRRDEFVALATAGVRIPYFNGHQVLQPAVYLRQRATGFGAWFLSVHNPADTGQFQHQGGYRLRAVAAERRVVIRLAAQGAAVLVMGDFNDRATAFCPLTAGGLLHASSGGNGVPRCHPPARMGIDWIFATDRVKFTSHRTDGAPRDAAISDHPVVVADLRLR